MHQTFSKKKYNSETTIDEEGFQVYKRRDNGEQIKKGKATLDNRFVVSYNRDLLATLLVLTIGRTSKVT